ncbi:hypothetical protein PHYSODRAFT_327894 [Phytophthora sojae]|uniref:Uncharacterized protein n=1 Tax=Phytophthora sojae (strain P6497) TaxID=1094619 RepID=G4Z843_PHYSP|nr:hypothetical protein PHYSODRAFT_327894 [Phytophthora sojae]EGZ19698.1 hypothetical protein PHYSODRAFT_327894 [Phytophthora sojae]|eukprot:XP_009522415.1 hypothetical protein PHYSODRAFT_327894 [Phytophthora sojae]
MDPTNDLAAGTPAAKTGLSIQPATDANTSTLGAKFAQKAGTPSNQDDNEASDEARKSALEKQFIASQAITGLGRPLASRRQTDAAAVKQAQEMPVDSGFAAQILI